jgi:hypothetical protein
MKFNSGDTQDCPASGDAHNPEPRLLASDPEMLYRIGKHNSGAWSNGFVLNPVPSYTRTHASASNVALGMKLRTRNRAVMLIRKSEASSMRMISKARKPAALLL